MKSHISCAKKKRTVTHEFIYLFISYKKRKSFNEKKFNEPPNPFGCVLVLLSYHKFRNSTIPFAPFELRTFFYIFHKKKKCEEKLKFIDRVKVEKEKSIETCDQSLRRSTVVQKKKKEIVKTNKSKVKKKKPEVGKKTSADRNRVRIGPACVILCNPPRSKWEVSITPSSLINAPRG